MRNDKKHPAPVDASSVQEAVQAAKTLASIPGQDVLEDPATNPQTRGRYDALLAQRLERELELTHQRRLRAAEEENRREGHQAEVDRIIASARQATSPAKTVVDMTHHQRRFGRVVLAASLALSVGSAMGLAALVESRGGPMPVGYLAEVGLTGLSTTVIIWRGILARAGAEIDSATNRFFLGLMIVPLLISVVGSTLGSGPVGAACSIGSGLFAALAYLINTSAASAIMQALGNLNTSKNPASAPVEEAPGEAPTAPGGPLPRRSAPRAETPAPQPSVSEDAAAWLASVTPDTASQQEADEAQEGVEQEGAEEPAPRAETLPTLPELGLFPDLEGARWEIMLYIHAFGRGVSTRQIVRATRLPRSTVRDYRTALWHDGYEAFDPNKVNDS